MKQEYYEVTHDACETIWSGTIEDLLTTKCEGCGKTFLEKSDERASDVFS